MKGQSILISHALLVGFSIFLVFVVVSTFISLHANFQGFISDKELRQVCIVVRDGVEKIYSTSSYRSPARTVQGTINLNLPDKIAGLNYRVGFVNRSVSIEYANTRYTCKTGFDAEYSGSSSGGLTRLTFVRNSTADRIEIESL